VAVNWVLLWNAVFANWTWLAVPAFHKIKVPLETKPAPFTVIGKSADWPAVAVAGLTNDTDEEDV
jgi:hypothetical protein